MKASKIINLFLFLTLIVFTTCDPFFNCIEGNGKQTSEYRGVPEFYGVINNTDMYVRVSYDSSETSLRVDADDNLIESIVTNVKNGDLYIDIDNDRCIEGTDNIIIEIRTPNIDLVESNGSGDMDVYDFESENFSVNNTGSGNIDIRDIYAGNIDIKISGSGAITALGKANSGNYVSSGSGEIYASDMILKECFVNSSGSGNIYCFAYDLLSVILTGSGNVEYSGSPVLSVRQEGSGSVQPLN